MGWGAKRAEGRRARRAAEAGAEHRRRRLVAAADWAITAASRRLRADGAPVRVDVADVIARAADDGLAVGAAEAAAVLRERFALRAGWLGLATDAFETGAAGPGETAG